MRMVMVLAAMAAWTAAGQVFPPPPAGGAQGGAGGEAMPPAPGPLYGAVRAAGTVRRGDAVVWGDAQGRTITGADMGNSAWASTGMVAAAVSAAAAGMATTQQVAAAAAALAVHTNRTDNPHGVTAAQIGALTAEQDPVANAKLAVHTNRTDNPHGVTAAQIGALTAEQDLAALRTYHYGSPDIVESPAEWFVFDGAGTITAFNWEAGRRMS
jgi:hypothetical protein